MSATRWLVVSTVMDSLEPQAYVCPFFRKLPWSWSFITAIEKLLRHFVSHQTKQAAVRRRWEGGSKSRRWAQCLHVEWFAVKPASLTDCAEGPASQGKQGQGSADCKVLYLYLLQEAFLDYSYWCTPCSAPSKFIYAHIFLAVLHIPSRTLFGIFNHPLLSEDLGDSDSRGLK